MRTKVLCLLVLSVLALPLWATSYTINDSYPGSYCGSSTTPGCDVVGDPALFDIKSIKFVQIDSNLIQAEIDLNYNRGDISLSNFSVSGDTLSIGDLMFSVSGVYKYGTAVKSHGAVPDASSPYYGHNAVTIQSGVLYKIVDPSNGVLTAQETIGEPDTTLYRANEAVWIYDEKTAGGTAKGWVTSSGLSAVSAGSAHSVGGYEIIVPVAFRPTAEFMADLLSGNLSVHFASATCANDIIDGRIAIPEPGTWALMGFGLVGLGLLRRRGVRK